MTRAYAQPEKESFCLVTFQYGSPTSPTFSRYTDWNEDYVGGYVGTPAMKITLPENSGTFEERTLKIEMPLDAFTDAASGGLPHSPIYVTVQEISRALSSGPEALSLFAFKGRVIKTVRNSDGRSGRVMFHAQPVKSRLEIPLALSCNHHCPWTLFGRGCGLTKQSFLATITAIDGKRLTTASASITTGHPDKFWHRGYVEYQGLRIGIQNWSLADPTYIYLVKQPPASWLGPTLTFVPGCDKTIETCRSRYGNEEHFGGVGYAIPAYNPILEDPA